MYLSYICLAKHFIFMSKEYEMTSEKRYIRILGIVATLIVLAVILNLIATNRQLKAVDDAKATMTAAAGEFHRQLTAIHETEGVFNELEDSKLELIADFQDTAQVADENQDFMNALQTAWAGTKSAIERAVTTPIP